VNRPRILGSRLGCGFLTVIVAGAAGSCEGEAERPKPPPQVLVQQFPIPTAGAQPQGIAAGPDGGIWFTERSANKIGRIEAALPHTISEYPLPTPASGPYAITAGPDGKMWFTEHPGDRIGWIDARSPGKISELLIPTSNSWTRAITAGPDRNVWFVEKAWRVGRVVVKPAPAIGDFPLPRYGTAANDIAAGPDGNLWYAANDGVVGRVLAIWPESILEIQLRTKKADSAIIAAGPDGNLWVAQSGTGTIARIQPTAPHTVTELRLPGAAAEPKGLCASPGYLWLSRAGQNTILRIEVAPPHHIREIPVPESVGPPEEIALGPDGNIWFTAPAGNSIGRLSVRALDVGDSAPENQASVPAVRAAEYQAGPGPVPEGELEIRTDVNCTVSIDGVEMFRLPGGEGRVVQARVGQHVVTGVSAIGPERWERSVEVFSGYRASASVELRPESRGEGPDSATFVPYDPRIEFVPIPAGDFVMGSDSSLKDEQPPHQVRLTRSFQMGKYEVTQAEWAAVMGPIDLDRSSPEWFSKKPRMRYGEVNLKNPVVGASWEDAHEFIEKLNALDARHEYRLPSEAEWEYACRAGTTVDLPSNIDEMAWHQKNFELELHPVGKKKPNAWGLYDMHGNADEWVADWYDKDYYRRTPPTDPPGPPSGQTRMYRGGDAWNPASNTRCASRHYGGSPPGSRAHGFRLVRRAR
jgi:formylglycine-generating enzyme required for sulfatase activity/streptogramin lyase